MRAIVPLALNTLVPSEDLFTHFSTLHGQAHVARVMVHASRLIEATGWMEEAPRLWAAVYLHDLARTHDGRCYVHGERAVEKLRTRPHLFELFGRGGVKESDYDAIEIAVTHHCKPQELDRSHKHWRLVALLKDADGLDRVRLGDLDPAYLRHPESGGMTLPCDPRRSHTTTGASVRLADVGQPLPLVVADRSEGSVRAESDFPTRGFGRRRQVPPLRVQQPGS